MSITNADVLPRSPLAGSTRRSMVRYISCESSRKYKFFTSDRNAKQILPLTSFSCESSNNMSIFTPTYYSSCIIPYDPDLNEAIGFTPAVVKRWKRLLATRRVFSARALSMSEKVNEATTEMWRLNRPGDPDFPYACRIRRTYQWMLQCLKRQLSMCIK